MHISAVFVPGSGVLGYKACTQSASGEVEVLFLKCGDGKWTVGVMMLPSQTWVCFTKTNVLILGCGEAR